MRLNNITTKRKVRGDSIVGLLRLGFTLPLEIVGVVFLRVPPVLGVLNVEAPAHHLGVSDCVVQTTERH